MVADVLWKLGVKPRQVEATALGSIVLSLSLWIRAKTVDESLRANAERRAMFVGLWAPTLWAAAGDLRSLDR